MIKKNTNTITIHHTVHKFLLWPPPPPHPLRRVVRSFEAPASAVIHPEHACTYTQSRHPRSHLTLTRVKGNVCMATLTRDDISLSASPYACHAPAFGQNKSEQIFLFSWVWQPACESPPALGWAAVSPFSVFSLSLFLFFSNTTLKHDLFWILTCDKLYTLLIACQLEGWSRAFQSGTAALVGGSRVFTTAPFAGFSALSLSAFIRFLFFGSFSSLSSLFPWPYFLYST